MGVGKMKLSDKVEELDGPCREVDREVLIAIGYVQEKRETDNRDWLYPPTKKGMKFSTDPYTATFRRIPSYTASIDAALTLMPEGWKVTHLAEMGFAGGCYAVVAKVGDDFPAESDNGAKTMAIALLTAILRARGL